MGHQTGSGRSPGFMKKQGPPPCGRNMVGSFMDYISDGPSFRTSALSLPIRKHMVYEADMTKFTVNDRPVQYRMDPDTPLLWALRDASNLTGTKYGCGTGDCGACTVEIDGEAVRSCQISKIGSAHVRTPVTNTHIVCSILLEKKKNRTK